MNALDTLLSTLTKDQLIRHSDLIRDGEYSKRCRIIDELAGQHWDKEEKRD